MYRGRPWTIRQYAGFASAEETNERFRYLLERGQTGLSVAFDLPTQLGYDSDDPRALGEVGRTGVAIDSLADMELLFREIPLGEVSTSMTINAPASLLLLLYELVAEEQGVEPAALRGTVQNDILKEYIARGNYIFPPRPSMRLTTDLFAYCAERIPRWNTISISGYHIREAGSTAVQEIAFTLANGIAYCEAAVAAGLSPDDFGARLSFFFNAHNHFFQEVAKFRAARRLWAQIMKERFGATNPKALALRFHAQTGGSTLTAQQPESNVVRVAIQALSAVCGGAQSLHTNGFDEALALPTEHSARIALRTQQLLAHEAGGTDTADPLGGAYFIEELTRELEERARELIARVDELGGAVAAVEQGFVQGEIEEAAYRFQQQVETGERVLVGVNRFVEEQAEEIELHRLDPAAERRQLERTARVRAERSAAGAEAGARARPRDGDRRREPAAAAARGAQGPLHDRRDLRPAARGVGHVRHPAAAPVTGATVARISVAPVKGFRLLHPDEVELGPDGVAGNRRFFVAGADGQRLRTSATAWLSLVEARWDAAAERLSVRFPDGEEVEGDARAGGEAVRSTTGALELAGRVVEGPWDGPLSRLAGAPVRLVRSDGPSAGLTEPLSFVSDGSLRRLAEEAGVERLDARRFRMLFELAGCEPHAEDAWEGRGFRLGEAVVRLGAPVDRCAVTTRDPETARRDLDTLRLLARYRGRRASDGAVLFGVWGTVEQPGRVRVGDELLPLG